MRWIVSSSVKFRLLAIFIGAAMMFFGAQQLRDMPMDAFPEFAPPRVEIQTICLGLNAAEVESLVSVPLEQSLNGLDGLHLVRSKSVPQLSSIELQFDPGTDILHARQLVAERVTVGHALAADVGRAAGHHPADVDDGPRREDRRLVEDDVDPAPVDDRLLEDQGAAAAHSRRRQRRDLGRAPGAVPRARRPQPDEQRRGSRSTGSDGGHLRRPGRRPAAVLERRDHRHRRIHRHARISDCSSTTSCRSSHPADLAKVAVKGSGANAVRLGDVADLTIGTQALVRRRGRQRRPGPAA